MEEIRNVTGTAFIVAEYRAEENAASNPLYRDPIVTVFLNDASKRAAADAFAASPSAKEAIKLRTRYFDDVLEETLANGCRQVVILGAGLDTRAVRKRAAGVAYYEFDDGATLAFKQVRYREHGIDADLTLIPANYVTEDWIDLLKKHRFDVDLPTHFIWEGNTMYLTLNDVKQVMAKIHECIKRFTLSFDYLSKKVIAKTTGDPAISEIVDHFARMGAPWITGIDDVHALADEMGLALIEDVAIDDLHRQYWPNRPITSSFVRFYSLCTLASQYAKT